MISLLHGDTRHVKVSHFKCMGARHDHVVKRNVERSDGRFLKETRVTKLCRLLDESYTYVRISWVSPVTTTTSRVNATFLLV